MNLNYHNKITIKTSKHTYTFYNQMLDSVYQKIANLDSFFDKIAIGTGNSSNISLNHKLTNFYNSYNLTETNLNNNLNNSTLSFEKNCIIDTSKINVNYITEAGITSNTEENNENPTIYNYFSFIDENNPNGIFIDNDEPLIINITIYLNLSATSMGLFTNNNNKFIKFLLGGGIPSKQIYVARGNDNSSNILINRSNDYVGDKFPCQINSSIDDGVSLIFSGDLNTGTTTEIVFLIDNEVFARINADELQESSTSVEQYTAKRNYVIDLGNSSSITDISTIYNNQTNTTESNYYLVKYASDFGSKVNLPFNNLFNTDTRKFISRDGDKIIFLIDSHLYLYKNNNLNISEILSVNLQIQNITHVTSFDNFVFVFSSSAPYIHAFVIENNSLISCNFNISDFPNYGNIEGYTHIDIVQGKNGVFMLGMIVPISTTTAYSLYFNFDNQTKTFSYSSHVETINYNLSYILPFHKNNFSDAQFIYLQAGKTSSACRRIIHDIDGKITTTSNVIAYYYTYLTTNISVKSRAVVIEKDYTPNFWLYYYPQIYRFELSEFSNAEKSYISTSLLYLIQRLPDKTYKAYHLVGYDTATEFNKGMPKDIDQSKIVNIEFLKDVVLFFMNDSVEPIVAYSLNEDGLCIENVTTNNVVYDITISRKEVLGSNNKGVTATLSVNFKI